MDVKPLHAALIVIIAIVLVALAAYSGTQARLVLGPSDLRVDHADNLHLRIGQQIFVYDDTQSLVNNYSLDDFGITGLLGSFDFFPDNSLLLVADSFATKSTEEQGQLLRCSFEPMYCVPLTGSQLSFRRSFRAYIDKSENLFLADTMRDAVYWLDANGHELDKLTDKINLPGQVRRVGNRLAIANTDNRELLIVPLEGDRFADTADHQRIAMDAEPNKSRRERRPTEFIYLDSGWYILVKTSDGRSGSVYHYDEEGEYRSHFTLPKGADPLAIAYFGDSILVADYRGMKVYRYTEDGRRLEDLDSPEQRLHIQDLEQRRLKFSILEYASWGVFGLALIVGIVVGIRSELKKNQLIKKQEAAQDKEQVDSGPTNRPHHMEAGIHWVDAKKSPLWIAALGLLMVLAMPLTIALGIPEADDPGKACSRFSLNIMMWGFTAFMLVVFVPLAIKMRTLVSSRLGFRDEWVLADLGNGTVHMARDVDLIRVNNGFMIEGVTIPTGNPRMTLYKEEELKQWLEPRLKRGDSLGPIQQMKWQWHNRRELFVLSSVAIVAGIAMIVAMEMGWAEEKFEQWLKTQPECQKVVEQTPGD